jgi:hypothetical protein
MLRNKSAASSDFLIVFQRHTQPLEAKLDGAG